MSMSALALPAGIPILHGARKAARHAATWSGEGTGREHSGRAEHLLVAISSMTGLTSAAD